VPQTLLVVASVVILSVYGLNRHHAVAADERAVVGREVETAALAIGERWTGLARDLAFDESDVGAAEIRLRGNALGLSTRFGADAGEGLTDLTTLDDVDDIHGLSLTDRAFVSAGEVSYTVRAAVTYANPTTWAPLGTATPDAPTGSVGAPSTAKILTVVVREVTSGATRRPPVVVTLPVRLSAARQFVQLP
jgi:hypothetical protein